jgi:hypothetical protein
MSDDSKPMETYPGGFRAILKQMGLRMDPLTYDEGEALPPLDVDFQPLKAQTIHKDAAEVGRSRSTYARKYRELAQEFHRRPALLHLHGMLVSNLRRTGQPAHTAALFVRLWAEESEYLIRHLDARWLVSAITTFGDAGLTDTQRQLGQALSVLFGMMKLYETERLYSGHAPNVAFATQERSAKHLAMQMDPYAISSGGLDVNLLGGLWVQAGDDPVIRPLARHLLDMLIGDDKTVFRRLRLMRQEREAALAEKGIRRKSGPKRERVAEVPAFLASKDPDTLRWGLVSLIKAPLPQIARFAAHHLDLGADRLHIYLDAPAPETAAFLAQNPKVQVTECDAAFWAAQKKPRMKAHQMRQTWVATQAYQDTDVDWLAHIDVDEFLLPPAPMKELLAGLDKDSTVLRIYPVELLAGSQGNELFKLMPRFAGQTRGVLEDLYPTYGAHLPGGFISHREGKNFARTGLMGIRVGIHTVMQGGAVMANRTKVDNLYIGHAHAPDWPYFRDHMAFRMTRGSYRKSDEDKFRLLDILSFLQEEEGEQGVRTFFTEVCEATPRLIEGLEAHNMLLRYPLDLDAKVLRHFGPLPEQETTK